VAILDAGVADGYQNGQMVLELVYLTFKAFGHTTRPKKIWEGFCQFMRCPPHPVQLFRDFLSIQVQERTLRLNQDSIKAIWRKKMCRHHFWSFMPVGVFRIQQMFKKKDRRGVMSGVYVAYHSSILLTCSQSSAQCSTAVHTAVCQQSEFGALGTGLFPCPAKSAHCWCPV